MLMSVLCDVFSAKQTDGAPGKETSKTRPVQNMNQHVKGHSVYYLISICMFLFVF